MTFRSYFGNQNSTLGPVVPLAMFLNEDQKIMTMREFFLYFYLYVLPIQGSRKGKVQEKEERLNREEKLLPGLKRQVQVHAGRLDTVMVRLGTKRLVTKLAKMDDRLSA